MTHFEVWIRRLRNFNSFPTIYKRVHTELESSFSPWIRRGKGFKKIVYTFSKTFPIFGWKCEFCTLSVRSVLHPHFIGVNACIPQWWTRACPTDQSYNICCFSVFIDFSAAICQIPSRLPLQQRKPCLKRRRSCVSIAESSRQRTQAKISYINPI